MRLEAPERARPRAQQCSDAGSCQYFPGVSVVRALLRPRTGALPIIATLLLLLPLAARSSSITFSPGSGQQGDIITITGTGIGSATKVEFNTNTPTLADFTNVSTSELLAIVPQGATNGAIGVLVGGSWIYSTATFLAAPVISSFSPQSGANPTMVYILGANFIIGGTSVFFPGVSTPVEDTMVAPTEIEVTVPFGAGNGPLTVVTSAGTNVSTNNFLASSVPTISSISPSAATNGETVDIFGGNFFTGATVKFGTIMASSPSIVSTTEISVTVPAGATSSNVTVTTTYGSATYSNFVTATGPIVTNFSPTIGVNGTSVTITGFNLTSVSNVTINGVKEQITSTQPSVEINLTNNPGTGPIKVTAGGISFTTPNNFTNSAAPFVTSVYPLLGPPGSYVTINGLNFASGTVVKFGANSAVTAVTSQTELSATVPSIATGNYTLVVANSSGSFTNSSNFTITGAAPVITSFTPTNGVRGTTVTLNGANFTNLTSVQFNGVTASYQPPTSSTVLMATVPADVTTGSITVANSGGTGASPSLFYMQPWITSLSANGGIVNSSFTINGRSLTGASAPLVNGISFTNFTVTATQMVATIPSNATSGTIEITTPGGNYISTNVFAILPKIYSFSPNIGPAGTVVTISGTSLFDVTSVQFGGASTANFTAGTNQVQVVVPTNALSGPLTVVTPYGSDVSSNSFTATKSSTVLLTKTGNPLIAGPGTNITYLLVVTNEGPSIITSTFVTDALPAQFTFVSANTTVGNWVYTNTNVVWNIGSLTNNNTVSLSIVGTSAYTGAMTNSAALAFAEGNLAYYDGFAAVTNYFVSAAQRTLSIALQTNPAGVLISWPQSAFNFQLQTNNGSNLNIGWTTLSNGLFVTNSLNAYLDSITAPQTFFRLATP